MSIKDLPTLIEDYAAKRDERLARQRETDSLKREETVLQQQIIELLRENNMTSAGAAAHKVTLKTVDKPVALDWDEVYTYIAENGAWDLLQRRLGETAVKARWEDGIEIPGVGAYPVEKLSLSKA